MKNRIENLLSKIAGKDDAIDIAPANRMEAALNDIAENGSGGSGGGGSNDFVITMTNSYDAEEETTIWTADKTYEEVSAAHNAGKRFVLIAPDLMGGDGKTHIFSEVQKAPYMVTFVGFLVGTGMTSLLLTFDEDAGIMLDIA